MTPQDETRGRLVEEWLHRAELDLNAARELLALDPSFVNIAAFHCQQAAEKYLKAFLVWRQVSFPKTHDLQELLNIAASIDRDLAASLSDVIVLTPYGVELRYPGDRPDATLGFASKAIDLAQSVRDAVLTRLPRG